MPSSEFKMRAETRLDEAASAAGLTDPRVPLRARLRDLREGHPAAFEKARAHYEENVLRALAEAVDPLAAWVEYARFLAQLTSPARLLSIDGSGRATPYQQPAAGALVMIVPEDNSAPVLVALAPAQPTPAQQATIDLLVNRKLAL